MPADTRATAYEWLMVPDESEAIIKFRWEPRNGVITSSMGEGTLQLLERDEPGDEWEPFDQRHSSMTTTSWDLPWVIAQSMARNQGFTVEVPIYDARKPSDDLPPPSAMTQEQTG